MPHPGKRLREIEAHGGKIWIVDPRRTETAKVAGEYVALPPDIDVFFYLSFRQALIAKCTRGFEEIRTLVEPWTLARRASARSSPSDHETICENT